MPKQRHLSFALYAAGIHHIIIWRKMEEKSAPGTSPWDTFLISSVEKYGFGRVKNNARLPNETPIEDVKRFKGQSIILTIVILVLSYAMFTYGMFENAHGVVPYTSWIF